MSYLKETVHEYGIDKHIRFRNRVERAEWSSADNLWTVRVEADGEQKDITCSFLFACSGYYNYDEATRRSSPAPTSSPARLFTPSTGRKKI